MSSKRAWFGLAAILLASPAAAQTAWNNGTFIDGQALHALDLNRNNAWLLAHSGGGGGGGSIPTADLLGGSGIGFIGRAVGSGLLLSGNVLSLAPPFNAAATNGQLLIGNGSGFTASTLTAGSNITVTNTSGHITIAANGGSPGGSSGQIQYNNSGAFGGLTDTQLTTHINAFTSSLSGAAPASGGGTANFLRADGTWSAPPSANPFPITPAGSTQSVGQITVSGSNSGMAIVPTGTGAFMLSIPDGTTTGGNARGQYAIDLQTLRNDASQVASGPGSILIGEGSRSAGANSIVLGYASGATGIYSVAIGGENAAFSDVAVALGQKNTVRGRSSSAIGEGNTSNGARSFVTGAYGTDRGASQASIFSSSSQRAQLEEYIVEGLGGSSSPFILGPDGTSGEVSANLPSNSSWIFYIELVVNDRGNGACVYTMGPGLAWRGGGDIIMGAGNPVFVLGPSAGTTTSCIMATVPTVTADTTRQGFTITITPNAGNTSLLVVTARIRATWAY